MAIKFACVDNAEGFKKLPKWKRSVAFDEDTKRIFIPSAIISDPSAMLCALFDGVTVITEGKNHCYLPTDWLVKQYPETKLNLESIEQKTRTFFKSPSV